jgi:hypothetical protein
MSFDDLNLVKYLHNVNNKNEETSLFYKKIWGVEKSLKNAIL